MRNNFILIFTLLLIQSCSSQSKLKPDSTDISNNLENKKFRVIDDSVFPYIEIKTNGKWQDFRIIENPAGSFECEYFVTKINGLDSKALILNWSNAVYGSGGGTQTKGLEIWNLDNATKLLDEIVFCSEESFGRNGRKYYLITCQKEIKIENKNINVYKLKCETEQNKDDKIEILKDNCDLSTIKPDIYIFSNGQLKRK